MLPKPSPPLPHVICHAREQETVWNARKMSIDFNQSRKIFDWVAQVCLDSQNALLVVLEPTWSHPMLNGCGAILSKNAAHARSCEKRSFLATEVASASSFARLHFASCVLCKDSHMSHGHAFWKSTFFLFSSVFILFLMMDSIPKLSSMVPQCSQIYLGSTSFVFIFKYKTCHNMTFDWPQSSPKLPRGSHASPKFGTFLLGHGRWL